MFDRVRVAWSRFREELADPFDVPDWPEPDESAGFWDAADSAAVRAAEREVRRG